MGSAGEDRQVSAPSGPSPTPALTPRLALVMVKTVGTLVHLYDRIGALHPIVLQQRCLCGGSLSATGKKARRIAALNRAIQFPTLVLLPSSPTLR